MLENRLEVIEASHALRSWADTESGNFDALEINGARLLTLATQNLTGEVVETGAFIPEDSTHRIRISQLKNGKLRPIAQTHVPKIVSFIVSQDI